MPAVAPESRMSARAFARETGVSRETLARLELYVEHLARWQRAINLVGRSTLADPWRRHILDSAQLLEHLPADGRVLADLGSGAGLPGLILAIMGVPEVHLIESDRRKALFLREAARVTGCSNVTVHNERVEAVALKADIVTARALASLDKLLALSAHLRHETTVCLFLKGRRAADELTEAGARWTMTSTSLPSRTDPDGVILTLRDIARP